MLRAVICAAEVRTSIGRCLAERDDLRRALTARRRIRLTSTKRCSSRRHERAGNLLSGLAKDCSNLRGRLAPNRRRRLTRHRSRLYRGYMSDGQFISFGPYRLIPAERLLLRGGETRQRRQSSARRPHRACGIRRRGRWAARVDGSSLAERGGRRRQPQSDDRRPAQGAGRRPGWRQIHRQRDGARL